MCDVPVCTQGCLNGNCSVPNTCFCYSGMSFKECIIFSIIEFQAGMGRCATSPFVVRSAIWHMPHARLRAAATAIQVSCLHPCQSSHLIANFQAGLDPAATRQSACPAAPRPMATASTRFQHTAIFIRFSHSHRLRACARTPHPGRCVQLTHLCHLLFHDCRAQRARSPFAFLDARPPMPTAQCPGHVTATMVIGRSVRCCLSQYLSHRLEWRPVPRSRLLNWMQSHQWRLHIPRRMRFDYEAANNIGLVTANLRVL